MSIHAHLSPEAEDRIRAQKRNSTISSIVISLLVVVLIALILFLIALPGFFVETKTIVAYNAPTEEDNTIEKKEVTNQIQRKPSAPSSAMARVLATNTPSPTAIPVPDVTVPEPSADFGSGSDFGDGWGGAGDGAGAFANIPSTMRKRCSLDDRLQRLKENGGDPKCEEAVVKALDWLQSKQNKDGSWCGSRKVAMTGFALLAYLGHCETPLSEKYGETVLKAMTFLIGVAESQKGKLADNLNEKHWPYEHAIATYALAEAQTFCSQMGLNIPGLEKSVQSAGQFIIDNQHPSGSWDYSYNETDSRKGDNSIGAWHIQALKACKHTGLEFRNMRGCVKDALDFMESCKSDEGAIGYTGKNNRQPYESLAGAGALCFQMWDREAHRVAREGCDYVAKRVPFSWDSADCDLYALYYNAQAMINRGGNKWVQYNKMFLPHLLANQNPDGSWKNVGGGRGRGDLHAPVPDFEGGGDMSVHYRTCLVTLTLEVYYRFLPGTGGGS